MSLLLVNATIDHSLVALFKIMMIIVLYIIIIRMFVKLDGRFVKNNKLNKNEK